MSIWYKVSHGPKHDTNIEVNFDAMTIRWKSQLGGIEWKYYPIIWHESSERWLIVGEGGFYQTPIERDHRRITELHNKWLHKQFEKEVLSEESN